MEKLAVVIPVYNEEGAIGEVITSWVTELRRLKIRFSILVFNDGSKDKTLEILRQKAVKFSEVQVFDQKNRGHGAAILNGYRAATTQGFTWIFQTDGDNEMTPAEFENLWAHRNEYDFLIAGRANRQSPLPRRIITKATYWTSRVWYGGYVDDVNSPYRLMRASFFGPIFITIPSATFAPNVILSGAACRTKARIYQITAQFQSRKSGTVSIKKWKLLKAALKSFRQTVEYSRNNRKFLQEFRAAEAACS